MSPEQLQQRHVQQPYVNFGWMVSSFTAVLSTLTLRRPCTPCRARILQLVYASGARSVISLCGMAGDVVVGLNGRPITKGSDLIGAMDTLEDGQTVRTWPCIRQGLSRNDVPCSCAVGDCLMACWEPPQLRLVFQKLACPAPWQPQTQRCGQRQQVPEHPAATSTLMWCPGES